MTFLCLATSGPERAAVGLAGVLGVGRRPGDDRAQRDERRLVRDRFGRAVRRVEGGDVLFVPPVVEQPVDALGVPAVRVVPLHDVLVERDDRVVFDRDVIVVVEQRELPSCWVPAIDEASLLMPSSMSPSEAMQ